VLPPFLPLALDAEYVVAPIVINAVTPLVPQLIGGTRNVYEVPGDTVILFA
jgi:hypothetical protein